VLSYNYNLTSRRILVNRRSLILGVILVVLLGLEISAVTLFRGNTAASVIWGGGILMAFVGITALYFQVRRSSNS